MSDFVMPTKPELSGLIDAGDTEQVMALWERAEEAVLAKAAEIDEFQEVFDELERQFKKDLRARKRELATFRFNAKKLDSARFAADRRRKTMDNLARNNHG